MIDINIVLQETPKIVVWWVEIGAVWRPDIGGSIGDQLVPEERVYDPEALV